MITAMTYGELTRGLHLDHTVPDIGLLDIGSGTNDAQSIYHRCLESPTIVPAPSMHDLDYFPHRVILLGGNCTGCLRTHVDRAVRWDGTDARCGCGYGYGGCTGAGGCNFSRSSTPRNFTSGSVSVRRANTHPRSKPPYSRHRTTTTSSTSAKKIQRSRSLTDIHSSGALAPSPLRNCAAYDEAGLPIRVGQVYESLPESVRVPGMKSSQSYHAPQRSYPIPGPPYVPTPSTARQSSLHTPPTVTTRNAYSMSTPASSLGGTPVSMHTPVTAIMATPAASIMVTPASAISPVSPIGARFRLPMTHGRDAFGEGAAARVLPESEQRRAMEEPSWQVGGNGGWGGHDGSGIEMEMEEEEDTRTEVGSPEMGMGVEMEGYGAQSETDVRLPPLTSFLPSAPVYPPYGATAQQTRRAMRSGAVSQDVLLYGPAGVTPAPAELARNNACDKLPPVPSVVPTRQATFFGIQNVPMVDGSGRFATLGAPGVRPMPARPVYPPAGIAPLIAGHQGLPHGGLTAPIERGDEMHQWKENQRAKERADVVVKDGELTVAERLEMEKRVSMSVKVINHIYYGSDDLPKARSPAQLTRRLPDEGASRADAGPSSGARTGSVKEAYWPPTPSSMPSSPESPKTRRDRQRASMRKDVFGDRVVAAPKSELEEMVRAVGSPSLAVEEPEEEADPSREPPARTLTWFVTEVLRRSRTSINVLQVALAYLAGAKPEIHTQLRAAADRQAELALQIAGIPQHVRDALPNMDWLGSEFTPSPLIDPRRTFLASLVLASKFLLDKAFSNKAWAKLSGLEALEVGKCERALGTALNWRLWVGREASRESHLDHAPAPPPPSAMLSPAPFATSIRPGAQDHLLLSRVQDASSPARSSSPWGSSHGSIMTTRSTPTLDSSSDLGSDPGALPGFDDGHFTRTPEAYHFADVTIGAEDEMLHRSPESGYLRAATAGSTHASDAVANSRPMLPSIRSFDRPPLRHGPSEIATPQTESNLGCVHMPSICLDRPSTNELPLAYANLAQPWRALNKPHWDFTQGGVVGE